MATPDSIVAVQMLPVTKQEVDKRQEDDITHESRRSSRPKTSKHERQPSETDELIRMLQEALNVSHTDAETKPRTASRLTPDRCSTSLQPSVGVIKRKGSSLSVENVKKIEKENARLLVRLTEMTGRRRVAGTAKRALPSSVVNRRREGERIKRENAAMLQRIQSAKPSRDVSRETHKKHFSAHQRYSQNASRLHGYENQKTPKRPSSARRAEVSRERVETQYTWEAGW